jgi:hypothetical protein
LVVVVIMLQQHCIETVGDLIFCATTPEVPPPPRHPCLFTPELQWQSRGILPISQGWWLQKLRDMGFQKEDSAALWQAL